MATGTHAVVEKRLEKKGLSDFDFSKIRRFRREDSFEESKDSVVHRLEFETELKDLLVPPNIDDKKELTSQIMREVNKSGLAASLNTLGTTVIDPGMIGIISHNGNIEVAGPGRWAKLNLRANWVDFVKLTDAVIKRESLTIVRIPKGQYGLASENGKPLILAEGMHVRNSRMFEYKSLVVANSEHIQNGTINIIRVPVGRYGKVLENNIPKLLEPGNYATDSNYFSYTGSVPTDSDHISHETIHVVRVPKSSVTFCMINNKPIMLNEGTYFFNTAQFKLETSHLLTSDWLRFSTISRFFVKQGQIAKAWYQSKPIFIAEPGIYEFDDPNFVFVDCVPTTTKHIYLGSRNRFIVHSGEIGLALQNNIGQFFDVPDIYEIDDPNFIFKECVPLSTNKIIVGSKMRIIVRDGEIGETYLSGKLNILKPGTHYFDTVDRVFKNFIPTTQQCVDLCDEKGNFLTFDTVELVPIGIKAEVFYTIERPEVALIIVGDEKMIKKLVKDTSISTLNSIMRSTPLNKVAQSKIINSKGEREMKMEMDPFGKASEPLFFDKVHDEFIAKLHDTFMEKYGLNVSNIRIADFEIMNKQLVESISQQALTTAKTETERTNIDAQREILLAKEEQAAQVVRIKTQAEADKLKTDTDAKTKSTVLLAETSARETAIRIGSAADAEASRILKMADAEAKAIELKAAAEAKAIELRAAAEKKRAEALASTDIGGRIAMMTIQAEAAAKCFSNTQKMIYYIPQGTNMSQLSTQLFGIPGVGGLPGMPIVPWGPASAPLDGSGSESASKHGAEHGPGQITSTSKTFPLGSLHD